MAFKYSVLFFLIFIIFFASFDYAHAQNFTVEFGRVETVFDYTIQRCADIDLPDSPARAIVDIDGNLKLFAAHFVNRIMSGNNLNQLARNCNVIMNSDNDADPSKHNDFEWLVSPYTLDGQTIYGFIHNEYHGWQRYSSSACLLDFKNCWVGSVSMAKSVDKGLTFLHSSAPNHVVSASDYVYDSGNLNGRHGVAMPTNLTKYMGYYYMTTNVWNVPDGAKPKSKNCLMRTNNLDEVGSWRYWNGTDFASLASIVSANNDCASVPIGPYDMHWSDYLNSYVSLQLDNTLETSKDLINWKSSSTLAYPSPWRLTAYNTFLQAGSESRNFEDISRSPWMYYVTCGDEISGCDSTTFGTLNRDLKRVRVRFNKPEDVGKFDVLDLRFNEYKGTKALDSSFYGNDASIAGNTKFIQTPNFKFLRFGDSTSNVVVNPDPSLDLSKDISFNVNLRTSQIPAANVPLITKTGTNGRNYGLLLSANGKVLLSIPSGQAVINTRSNASVNDGLWHDITVTFSSTTNTATIYIDGKIDSVQTNTGKLSDSTGSGRLTIGGNSFVGDLDRLAIYNYVLPAPAPNTTNPTPTPSTAPVVYNIADLNQDGKVDILDYNILISDFGKTGNLISDIIKNQTVDIFDYNRLLSNLN